MAIRSQFAPDSLVQRERKRLLSGHYLNVVTELMLRLFLKSVCLMSVGWLTLTGSAGALNF